MEQGAELEAIPCKCRIYRWILILFFLSILFGPSVSLKVRSGRANWFEQIEYYEVDDFVTEFLQVLIPSDLDPELSYGPGMINTMVYTFSNGLRQITWIAAWNFQSCNLGNGGEKIVPKQPVPGRVILEHVRNVLLLQGEVLIRNGDGYAELIHEGISLGWFPDDLELAEYPSDDDPRDELFQLDSVNKLRNNTFGRRDFNVSLAHSSTNNSLPTRTSTSKRSDNQRFRGAQIGHGGVHMPSNRTFPFHKKFPVTPDGDCDLPSLILQTSRGPTYDDESTHGMQMLNPTDTIWSPNTLFYLTMQIDCNLVLYDARTHLPLWASDTYGMGSVCYASITMAGELVVTDATTGDVYFRTYTQCEGNGGACWTETVLQVQDDGNVGLYILATNYLLWQTDTVQCVGGCTP